MEILGTGRVIAILGAVAVLGFLCGLWALLIARGLEARIDLAEQEVEEVLKGIEVMSHGRRDLLDSLNYLGGDRGRQRPARH